MIDKKGEFNVHLLYVELDWQNFKRNIFSVILENLIYRRNFIYALLHITNNDAITLTYTSKRFRVSVFTSI